MIKTLMIMTKYKVLIAVTCAIILLLGLLSSFNSQTVKAIAKWRLENIFIDSVVSIRECRFQPASSLSFSGIRIGREGFYDFVIDDARADYDILSLLTGRVARVCLDDLRLTIKNRETKLVQAKDLVDLPRGGLFRVDDIIATNAIFDITTQDIALNGTLSIGSSAVDERVNNIDVLIEALKAYGVSFEQARIVRGRDNERTDLSVKKIIYNDLLLANAKGIVLFEDGALHINSLTSELLNGTISGKIKVFFEKSGAFSMDLTCAGMSLETFIKDFKLTEKTRLTGKMNGSISLKGNGLKITDMSGDFSTQPPGGVLIIKETRFLENMAKSSKQSLDLIMETFSNYRYTIGRMRVSLDGGDLLLDIALEGEAGKRTFNVILHDFITGKRRAL
jgi:hypothetical protein